MNTYQSSKKSSDAKATDASKYNLRCNRNISEKMTKKDFVYDIRPPLNCARKVDFTQFEDERRTTVLPLRRRQSEKVPRYAGPVNCESLRHGGAGDAPIISEQRALRFECNFCREPIATLFSLSTHVKFHRLRHCKTCYWILRENETMEEHFANAHRINSGIRTN